ncbi:MAG: hypothetical protein R6U95_08630 [Bacteroidales bacterium]
MEKKILYAFLIIFVIVLAISAIKPIIYSNTKVIDYKYIYFDWYVAVDSNRYKSVYGAMFQRKALQYRQYYKDLLIRRKGEAKKVTLPPAPFEGVPYPKFLKVGIVKYNKDSSLVKVKAKFDFCCRPQIIQQIRWVPSFTLHDTLPSNR